MTSADERINACLAIDAALKSLDAELKGCTPSMLMSVLAASGHTIVSNDQVREMIGPSREVDSCPKCGETVTWEQNGYDLRKNDDHRYSWVAYCEACKLDLELIPDPNPPIAAAAAAEEDTND